MIWHLLVEQEDHDMINQTMKDSQVLLTKDNVNWNWELIGAILQVRNYTISQFVVVFASYLINVNRIEWKQN